MEAFFEQFFDFGLMWDNRSDILQGFGVTLQLAALSGVLALIWGLLLAVLRQLPGRLFAPVRFLVIAYIDIFRGIPMLLLILMISGGLGALAAEGEIPRSIGIPDWLGKEDPFWYGVYAITITYGAYMAEVYRAGIEAVPSGQMEAARSLGMSHSQAMRHVIVPQAIRKVIPPLLNDFIALMKDTSLVSVIALSEVLTIGTDIYAETFNNSGQTAGAILFLLATIPLARIVDWQIAKQQLKFSRAATAA